MIFRIFTLYSLRPLRPLRLIFLLRNFNHELTSLSDFAFNFNFAAVRFDRLLDQAQAQPVAVNLFVNN